MLVRRGGTHDGKSGIRLRERIAGGYSCSVQRPPESAWSNQLGVVKLTRKIWSVMNANRSWKIALLSCLLSATACDLHAQTRDAETRQEETQKEVTAGDDRSTTAVDTASVMELVHAAHRQGQIQQGADVFVSAKFACLSCHHLGEHGGNVGPDLTQVLKERTERHIVESVLFPKREVLPQYIAHTVIAANGRSSQGYLVEEPGHLLIRDAATGAATRFATEEVDEVVETGTLMPEGLSQALSAAQRLNLFAFLFAVRRGDTSALQAAVAGAARQHIHAPTPFPFHKGPLRPELWTLTNEHVNRDRIYDFYSQQAEYFRQQPHPPVTLTAFPGIDGGDQGHWGNQNDDDTWTDDRWNQTDLGSLLAGVFNGSERRVARGVCVRLGDEGELAACFDPDTLSYAAVWSGGFLRFSEFRHGFLHGVTPVGQMRRAPPQRRFEDTTRYRGYYRHGNRTIFAYRVGDTEYLDAPWVRNGQFEPIVAPADTHPLRHLTEGGPSQWPQGLVTGGSLGDGTPYAIDTMNLPFDNPWNALVFCGGHDFLPDGSALVCTMQGDVWRVSGLEGNLKQVTWRRFASGLHHALGLVVGEDGIFVQCRDQLTRLHDLNGDGEADFYECFNNRFVTSDAGHDFICGLERDRSGNFYFTSGNEGLVRISTDGERTQFLANGFRNPGGLGLHADGTVTIPCSEGEWTPANMICALDTSKSAVERSFGATIGGHEPPYFGHGGPRDGRAPDLPLVYLPRGLDNSPGGQIMISGDRWGPLQGNMVHLSYGTGTHLLLLRDTVRGQMQGAVVPLPGDFRAGVHRGRFRPRDGQLYVTGMGGWGTYTPDDGCFQRIRYTGERVQLPVGFHVHRNGILLRFAQPLDPQTAEQSSNHFAQTWIYRYSIAYGSPEYSSRHYGARGHDVLPIAGAHVLKDGHSLFLELPDIQPVNQLHLRLRVGPSDACDIFATVHALDDDFTDLPGYQPRHKTVLPHPVLQDLAVATTSVKNRHTSRLKHARLVVIEAGKNLQFKTQSFSARPGEAIHLRFRNPDVVPHNWALLKPGTLRSVGQLTSRLISDPTAAARHYIPDTDDVLCYTNIVAPHDQFEIYFRAPEQPGHYPYLCTFPGHWMVMNGELIVTAGDESAETGTDD